MSREEDDGETFQRKIRQGVTVNSLKLALINERYVARFVQTSDKVRYNRKM